MDDNAGMEIFAWLVLITMKAGDAAYYWHGHRPRTMHLQPPRARKG
ncbi:MAG: hypothetical protein GWP06_17790 [Actinobacteria bacterium]|nr:hypothetical protein [Actinomycetota bacterium]